MFPTTYNSRDTWPMSAANFKKFCVDPERYVKEILGEHGIPPEQQSFELEQLAHPV